MTRRRRRWLLGTGAALALAGVLLVAFLFGWFAGPRVATTIPGSGGDAPRLLHVAGWRGPVAGDRRFLEGLRDGGCPHAMETLDWTDGHNGVGALWYAQRSDAPARRVAERIERLARDAPGVPIDVTADSCGCGVALAAIARLPADVRVRTVVLSSPAVSCGYDLAPVLAHVDGRLIAFRSDRDWAILGVGTWVFGTADGRHASGAGRYGFDPPRDAASAAKLRQIDYDAAWAAAYDNWGGHAQTLSARFARGYVAPLLLAAR